MMIKILIYIIQYLTFSEFTGQIGASGFKVQLHDLLEWQF